MSEHQLATGLSQFVSLTAAAVPLQGITDAVPISDVFDDIVHDFLIMMIYTGKNKILAALVLRPTLGISSVRCVLAYRCHCSDQVLSSLAVTCSFDNLSPAQVNPSSGHSLLM